MLDTFQLQDIQAEGNYLDDLGRPDAEQLRRSAIEREGDAEAAAILAKSRPRR